MYQNEAANPLFDKWIKKFNKELEADGRLAVKRIEDDHQRNNRSLVPACSCDKRDC